VNTYLRAAGESPRALAAGLIYDAVRSAGKHITVVSYGSLSGGKEWALRTQNPCVGPPVPVRVNGVRRAWTTFDALEQPENVRVFVDNKTNERFTGHFAVMGLEEMPGAHMDAAAAVVLSRQEFINVMESEVSYFPFDLGHASVIDPRSGRSLSADVVPIAFKQFDPYRETFLEEARMAKAGIPGRGMCVRDGYAEKSLAALLRLGTLRAPSGLVVWDPAQDFQRLLDTNRDDGQLQNYVPAVRSLEMYPVRPEIPGINEFIDELCNPPDEIQAVRDLLTPEGRLAAQPAGLTIADYLGPIRPQLEATGASPESLQAIDMAIRTGIVVPGPEVDTALYMG
jgi:hypothetical protein